MGALYHTFKEINIWPSQALIDTYMPKEFKERFPSTQVIIDATEFPLEKPSNPDVQAATWSNYKNRNTPKLLVGVSPNGVITFLSPLLVAEFLTKSSHSSLTFCLC